MFTESNADVLPQVNRALIEMKPSTGACLEACTGAFSILTISLSDIDIHILATARPQMAPSREIRPTLLWRGPAAAARVKYIHFCCLFSPLSSNDTGMVQTSDGAEPGPAHDKSPTEAHRERR